MTDEKAFGGDPIETAITVDYDVGEIWIDTNRQSVKTKLRKLGLTPISVFENRESYHTSTEKLGIGFRKRGVRKLSPEHSLKLRKSLQKAREKRKRGLSKGEGD
jgi:hypothetical protein